MIEFGIEVFVHVPKQPRRKWDPKGEKGLFMGYGETTKDYRIYMTNKRDVVIKRDVVFTGRDDSKPEKEDKKKEVEKVKNNIQDMQFEVNAPGNKDKVNNILRNEREPTTMSENRYFSQIAEDNIENEEREIIQYGNEENIQDAIINEDVEERFEDAIVDEQTESVEERNEEETSVEIDGETRTLRQPFWAKDYDFGLIMNVDLDPTNFIEAMESSESEK
ncbi:uncharacterized protein LOC113232042 [Hyposmocoma kahamanoa]|uniref:uncharacterized protein LOC113232042 n=1 Tax=Hyposmocoma kahamanoa TaxID=1477025 RepID=UPI000E6D7974|nr:uncharacterized protein LOC113232042 [Hyposmocoma kahamanoa]